MSAGKPQGGVYIWISFIGLVLLLIGIYGMLRTAINVVAFEKYPLGGVLSINFSGAPFYGPREEDCVMMSLSPPYPSYEERDLLPTEEAMLKEKEKEQQQSCMKSAQEAREQTKINDFSQSVLFLFLGAGVLIARKKVLA